jgi:superfamily II DNA or RNA helicase
MQGRGKALKLLKIHENPYDWQWDALKAWEDSGCRGIVVAPTATGKTLVAFLAMADLAVPTIVITPTEAVMLRWYNDLKSRGASVGKFFGGEKTKGLDVDVSIINSVERHPEILDDYEFIVIDEIHHLGGEEFIKLLPKTTGKKVMGLTSTPERADGRHRLIEQGISTGFLPVAEPIPVVYRLKLRDAVESKIIAPISVVTIGVPLYCTCGAGRFGHYSPSCEVKRYREMSEEISNLYGRLASMYGKLDITRLHLLGRAGMRLIGLISRRKKLLSEAYNKPPAVLDIVKVHAGENILVFSESIFSIVRAKNYLSGMGIKCGLYHSKMKDDERRMMFEKWARKEFDVLMSVRALDEGIDVPEAKIGIVIASGKAKRQWIQRIGRILRKTGKAAKLYIVYCKDTYEEEFPYQVRRLLEG